MSPLVHSGGVAPSQSPSAPYAPNGSERSRRLKIMVVDDDPDTVLTLLELLRDDGHDADGFGSGRAALDNLSRLDPDVIISDIGMPTPNGWDVAKEVRKLRGERRPFMIAITGQYLKSADRVLAQMSGFNYYLTKPCDPQVLLALIRGNVTRS